MIATVSHRSLLQVELRSFWSGPVPESGSCNGKTVHRLLQPGYIDIDHIGYAYLLINAPIQMRVISSYYFSLNT